MHVTTVFVKYSHFIRRHIVCTFGDKLRSFQSQSVPAVAEAYFKFTDSPGLICISRVHNSVLLTAPFPILIQAHLYLTVYVEREI